MSVSVVIPAYNAESYLRKALESVLNQTVPADEILVIDDGSTDGTRAVVESYAPRIRLLQQKNQGPSVARNLGVASTQSEFIAFLDADDSWHPRKIERQLATLADNPGCILCYSAILAIGVDGSEAVDPACPVEDLRAALHISNPGVPPSCVMVSRSAFLEVGGFNASFKGSEDWEFLLRLYKVGRFCVIQEPLTLYQVSTTGLSSDVDRLLVEATRMLPLLLAERHGLSRFFWRRRILSFQIYKAALGARMARQRSRELRYLLQSFLCWPSPFWHPRRVKVLAVSFLNILRRPKNVISTPTR